MSLQEAVSKQGTLVLDKAISAITNGDVNATQKLRDIYILLHSAEAKIINAQHRHVQLTTAGNSSVSIPLELQQAFHTAIDAMHVLQQRLWVDRYPVMLGHGESAEVCAMFSMNLEG